MTLVTEARARVLVEHALEWHGESEDGNPLVGEGRFADVIADLAAGRAVVDRELLVRFLWQRVSLAIENLHTPGALQAWHAAVGVLEELGEDLSDIYEGRRLEELLDRDRRTEGAMADLKAHPEYTVAEIAETWGFSQVIVESLALALAAGYGRDHGDIDEA